MERKIVKYAVVHAHSLKKLIQLVEDGIPDGWQPFGSVSATMDLDANWQGAREMTYLQAVVKYEK